MYTHTAWTVSSEQVPGQGPKFSIFDELRWLLLLFDHGHILSHKATRPSTVLP